MRNYQVRRESAVDLIVWVWLFHELLYNCIPRGSDSGEWE